MLTDGVEIVWCDRPLTEVYIHSSYKIMTLQFHCIDLLQFLEA